MMGHKIFLDLDSDKKEEEIKRRFRSGEFPVDTHVCSAITRKYWILEYGSAQVVVDDIKFVQKNINPTLNFDSLGSAA